MGVTVRQKKLDGPWWVFVTHKGKRSSKLVGDKKVADKLAKEMQGALAAGDLGFLDKPEAAGPTFAEYAKTYLKRAEPIASDPEHGLKRSTWLDYDRCIRGKLSPILGDRPLAEISRRDVRDLEVTLRGQGMKAANIRKHLRIVSSILSEAVEDELIPTNPALGLRRGRRSNQKAQSKKIEPLTEEEVGALLEALRKHEVVLKNGKRKHPLRRYHPFVLTLARTGLRLGEAIGLKWGDVDFRGGFIHVQRAYVRGEFSTPKSGKDRRVEMSDELQKTLRALFAQRFTEKVVPLEALDALVFTNEAGQVIEERNFRRRIFEKALIEAKLRKARIHDLRHTYASVLLSKGAPLKYVQEQLGHHSPAFTLERYGHLMPKDRHGFANLLDSAAPICTLSAPYAENSVSDENQRKKKALA